LTEKREDSRTKEQKKERKRSGIEKEERWFKGSG
jgi:hypothetical protein